MKTTRDINRELQEFREQWPHVQIFGEGAAVEYVQQIIEIMGSGYAYDTEEGFCQKSHCPPEKLEQWLRDEWIQHDLHKIERGEEKPGADPLLLEQGSGYFF